MEQIKKNFRSSVMTYITLSMASIIAVGLITIFISFWITELADKDAQAINLSGSMRMQTYHIALALEKGKVEEASSLTNQLDNTWKHSLFAQQRKSNVSQDLDLHFDRAYKHWIGTLKPLLESQQTRPSTSIPMELFDKQVTLTDQLVSAFQIQAEQKIRNLRAFQLFAFFITIGVGSIIFYVTKNRIERPLLTLSEAANRIGEGDYGHQVNIEGKDELAMLGAVINEMSTSIRDMYNEMDERVKKRTQELHEHNVTLTYLFKIARAILDNQNQNLDYQALLNDLSESLEQELELEFCLFTSEGERPYLRIAAEDQTVRDCSTRSCENCKGNAPYCAVTNQQEYAMNTKFPVVRDALNYGVINVRSKQTTELPAWQHQLLASVADQYALALSLSEQKDQEHRLAMLNERTVIARELHDSLAQSLSYLQIQATRLQKSHDKQKYEIQQAIIDELREGLSSAYRQLRELLTTFRLKIDSDGLESAVETTINQLADRSEMEINCQYQVTDLPLTPSEEIHLLQIIREGLQNAVNHSQGSKTELVLSQQEDKSIVLTLEDNGIGLPESPEKLNHYGLAIMQERARHLNGHIDISQGKESGTKITVVFQPQYLSNREALA